MMKCLNNNYRKLYNATKNITTKRSPAYKSTFNTGGIACTKKSYILNNFTKAQVPLIDTHMGFYKIEYLYSKLCGGQRG